MRKLLVCIAITVLLPTPYCYAEDIANGQNNNSYSYSNTTAPNKSSISFNYTSSNNFTGNFYLTSDYIWRGISQTNNNPAVQGDIMYDYKGIFAYLWSSNVQFPGYTADVEFAGSVGYNHAWNNGLAFTTGIFRYMYPDSHFTSELEDTTGIPEDLDYNEGYMLFDYKILQASVFYSSDEYNSGVPGTYYNGGINWDIPAKYLLNMNGFNINATIGRFILNPQAGLSYTDYYVALTKKFNKNLKLSLAWTDTNLPESDPLARAHLFATMTVSF